MRKFFVSLGLVVLTFVTPVRAEECSLVPGETQATVTEEGRNALCKTPRWKTSGTFMGIDKACPDCYLIKRGLTTTDKINKRWLTIHCPAPCVPTGDCSAQLPGECGQTATGTDNCGNTCDVSSDPCPPPCVPDGTCQMPGGVVPCGTTGTGIDSCGGACEIVGPVCPPANLAPVVQAIPVQTVAVGSRLTFAVNATDPEGATLKYFIRPLPVNAGFPMTTGIFTWTPSATQVGTYGLNIDVTDGVLSTRIYVQVIVIPSDTTVPPPTEPPPGTEPPPTEPPPSPPPTEPPPPSADVGFPMSVPITTAITVDYHVNYGLPLPEGFTTTAEGFRVTDQIGSELVSQFRPLARWPDGSLKSVFVSVLVPKGTTACRFVYTPNETRPSYTSSLKVEQTSQTITIQTGKVSLVLDTTTFNVGGVDLVAKTSTKEFRASADPAPRWSVVELGPVRTVIRGQGRLVATDGTQGNEWRVWLAAYADRDYMELNYTDVDSRPETNVNTKGTGFNVRAYGLQLPIQAKQYAFGGQNGAVHQGDISADKEYFLFQDGQLNYLDGVLSPWTFEYVATDEQIFLIDVAKWVAGLVSDIEPGRVKGSKAAGWGEVSSDTRKFGVAVRQAWQQYPKEFTATDHDFSVWLHSEKASVKPNLYNTTTKRYDRSHLYYSNRPGQAKSYELLLRWGNIVEVAPLFEAKPRLAFSPVWQSRSKVFGDLLEAGPQSAGYDDYLITGIYNPSVDAFKAKGWYAIPYSWRDFGDRMRGGWEVIDTVKYPPFYDDTHVGAHTFCVQFVRTGHAGLWDMCESASRHWMDIDVSHSSRWGYWKDWTKGGVLTTLPPGEPFFGNHNNIDHTFPRNAHPGHWHVSGLVEYYLLTGDYRAYEVIQEVGDWLVTWTNMSFSERVNASHLAEAERDFAWPLFALNQMYRATGEQKYIDAGARLVKHLIAWWQYPMPRYAGIGADGLRKQVGTFDWTQGTGYWWLSWNSNVAKDANGQIAYNGSNPWMGFACAGQVIEFLKLDRQGLVDHALATEMIFQVTQEMVKFGYNETKQYRPYSYFAYNEGTPQTPTSDAHIVYVLAWAWNELQKTPVTHPEWYDTAPKWIAIANGVYKNWQTVKYRGMTKTGWYGYEHIEPADFFKLMYDLTSQGIIQ